MQRRDLLKFSLMLGLTTVGGCSSVSRALQAGVSGGSKPVRRMFTEEERAAVAVLSEMIIPETDTPGAIEAGVPDFIETIYVEWYRDAERSVFLQGLADLDGFCQQHERQDFINATTMTQIEALKDQENQATNYHPPTAGAFSFIPAVDERAPFFKKIKDLVVVGYYTSEVGATTELIYLPAPGYYDGDVEFSKIGKQWTY